VRILTKTNKTRDNFGDKLTTMTTATATMTTTDRQAEAIITLLETFQPRIALQPYLTQLRRIVIDLETSSLSFPLVESSSSASSSSSVLVEENLHQTLGHHDDGIRVTAHFPHLMRQTDEASQSKPHHTTDEKRNSYNNNDIDDGGGDNNTSSRTTSYRTITSAKKNQLVNGCSELLNNILISTSSPTNNNDKSKSTPETTTTTTPLSSISSPSHQYWDAVDDRYMHSSSSSSSSSVVFQEVLNESTIVAKILEFDGSLALYYKNYDLIVGYKNPLRRRRRSRTTSITRSFKNRYAGTKELAFVNKTFYSLIIGPDGLKAWQTLQKLHITHKRKYAKEVIGNYPEYSSSLAKLFAVVICNDAIEFEYMLSKYIISIQQGTSMNNHGGNDVFGMALTEYVKGDEHTIGGGDRTMGIPIGHPFLRYCSCWNAKECDYTTLLAELAYNAVICGATDVLGVLSSRHNTLYGTEFGPTTGGQTLLGEIVAYACTQPCCLEEIADGIRTLMSNQLVDDHEDLHSNQRGSLGNSLHLAAAKGDRELVNALLDIGYDPSIRCDHRAILCAEELRQQKGYNGDFHVNGDHNNKLWLPEDWARVRGHTRVTRLLEEKRKQLQPVTQPQQQPHHSIATLENSNTNKSYDDESGSSSDYTSNSDYDSDSGYGSYDSNEETTDYDTENTNRSHSRRRSRRR
jgi:hypothetical protein